MASSLSDSLRIIPVSKALDAEVSIPGSKSITNRALLIAGLADGESTLTGVLFSDDTRYMAEALQALGLTIEMDMATETARVVGGNGSFPKREADLYVGNSGTTARFLTAALAVANGRFRIDGNERMRQRPIAPLLTALHQLGSKVTSGNGNDCLPLVIDAQGLPGGHCAVEGGLSSQYFSALLMAAPSRYDIEIDVIGDPFKPIWNPGCHHADFGVEATMDAGLELFGFGQTSAIPATI